MALPALPQFLRRQDVKDYFPFLTEKKLAWLASQRRGPHYAYIGRDAVYEAEEIERWIRAEIKPPGTGRPASPARQKGAADGTKRVGRPSRAETRRKRTSAATAAADDATVTQNR